LRSPRNRYRGLSTSRRTLAMVLTRTAVARRHSLTVEIAIFLIYLSHQRVMYDVTGVDTSSPEYRRESIRYLRNTITDLSNCAESTVRREISRALCRAKYIRINSARRPAANLLVYHYYDDTRI
jgi:hypothetical protein